MVVSVKTEPILFILDTFKNDHIMSKERIQRCFDASLKNGVMLGAYNPKVALKILELYSHDLSKESIIALWEVKDKVQSSLTKEISKQIETIAAAKGWILP